MTTNAPKKVYLQVPVSRRFTPLQRIRQALLGILLSPVYLFLAYLYHLPGLGFHLKGIRLGLRLLFHRGAPISFTTIYFMLFRPINCTRYFEFDFMWRSLSRLPIRRYLDVSSPRLFPIVLMHKKREMNVDLINPDAKDLAETTSLVKASGLEDRCHLHKVLIEEAPFEPESFDVITSISVVEHIPQDMQAIQKMWDLLKPKGRLLLSVPCAAQALEQYINVNSYDLLAPDERGYVFLQHVYDETLLQRRIFSVTGLPTRVVIYGERQVGALRRNLDRKWSDRSYPYWQEPYLMSQDFMKFDSLTDLPGEGVIMMEFVKE